MSLEAKIEELTAALAANSALLERVVAGQQEALAKVEAGSAGTGGTRTRRKPASEETPPVAAEEPASKPAAPAAPAVHPLLATPNGEVKKSDKGDVPTANYRAGTFGLQDVKNEFIGWMAEAAKPEDLTDRRDFVVALGNHFGVPNKLLHPTDGLKDEEQIKQALFYLRRKREGLKVDLGADYDFDGDPLADQSTDDDEVAGDFGLG